MRTVKTITFILIGVVIASCNQSSQKSETVKDKTSEDKFSIQKGEFPACQHASKIYWKGTKPTGEHNGIIKLKEGGDFVVTDGKLEGGTFIIDMNSIINIDIENEEMNNKLVSHLKSPDFFNVDSFPDAKFVITELTKANSDDFNTLVKGDMTIKGKVHPIEFKADVKISEKGVMVKSEAIVLDRTQWGINYKSKSVFKELKDKFIDDEFTVQLEVYSM